MNEKNQNFSFVEQNQSFEEAKINADEVKKLREDDEINPEQSRVQTELKGEY